MRKKFFAKSVALVICLAIMGITASGILAAEKRTTKIDARLIFQNPVHFLISFFPALNSLFNFDRNNGMISNTSDSSDVTKPTGELDKGKFNLRD
jgi:hypothetical protein